MKISLVNLVCLVAALFTGWLVQKIVYNLFLSPLRNIPGPLLARLTPLWLRVVDIAGNRTSTIHRLHQRYGSTVLIGPDEVSLSHISSVNDLYGQQTSFVKAPVYESMSLPPIGVFSMRDKTQHSQRRRLLSHAFSQSNLYECEPLIQKQILRLLEIVQESAGNPTDVLNLFRLTAFDIVGELFLGQAFRGLESGITPQFLKDMELYFILGDLKWNNPWIAALISFIPLSSVQYFLGSMQRLADYGEKAFRAYIEQYGRSSGRKDLLTKILSVKPETGQTQLGDRETVIEIGNLIFAGTDTTSTTLTFLFWELARNQSWQDRLREELQANEDSADFRQLQDLPVLDACINEALRLHPAAPASLPRTTPAGGRELNGFFIPEQTTVSMQCYTTHRDPNAFPDPETFKPERWIGSNGLSKEMNQLYMPFSKGPRACLGKNLAVMELKLITASLMRVYTFIPAPNTTEKTMAIQDHFLLIPVGGRCDLVFTEVRDAGSYSKADSTDISSL